MGLFDGLNQAKTFESGAYLNPGVYDVEITRVIVKETQNSGPAVIAELKIISSTCEKHPVGSKATWFQGMTKKDIALPALKAFVIAVMGLDEKDKTPANAAKVAEVGASSEALLTDATSDRNAFAGLRLHVQVNLKKTKKGLDFSQHVFSPKAA